MTGIVRDSGGTRVRGVEVDGEIIEGDAVVIAMGPWSILAAQWLPLPPVFGLKGHSLVFETGAKVPAEALFLEYQEASGEVHRPRCFRAPTAPPTSAPSPARARCPSIPPTWRPTPARSRGCTRCAPGCRRTLGAAKVLARQACHRPVTQDGLPLIGRVPGLEGAYVATGHSVWGILNAPATGEAVAELILDGAARSVDLAPFDPARLAPLDPARLRTQAEIPGSRRW